VVRILKWFLALLLVTWLVYSQQLDFSAIGAVFFSWGSVGIAIVLLMGFGLQIVRWFLLLRAGGVTITLRETGRVFWIGQFFFITSLGAAGGEAARGYYISRYAGEKTVTAISTALLDRIIGLYTFTLLGSLSFLTLFWQSKPPEGVMQMGGAALSLFLGISLFFGVLYPATIRHWLVNLLPCSWQSRFEELGQTGQGGKKALFQVFVVSVVTNIFFIITFKLASYLLGTPLSWLDLFLIIPLVVIANSLPISFGGLGVGEAAAQALMAQVGIDNGAAIMLLIRVTQWVTLLPIGGYFYLTEGDKKEKMKKSKKNVKKLKP
jgi:glycosyltransferase 2 family protein